MMKELVIKRLKNGDKFYNPHTGGEVVMSVVEWDGVGEDAKVLCQNSSGMVWQEDWDDMRFTINAFLIDEYEFV